MNPWKVTWELGHFASMLLLIYIPLLPAIGFTAGRHGCINEIPTVGLAAVELNAVEVY